jgi:tetratricopeptide (TPR) repeat protein
LISEEKRKLLELFEKGRSLYKLMKFKEAKHFFEEALKIDKNDGPSKVYVGRCEDYIESPPDPEWDGVYIMKNK